MKKKSGKTTKSIEDSFLKYFDYPAKNDYKWDYESNSKDYSRIIYQGEHKNNDDDVIFVKHIKIKSHLSYQDILKETYFLVLLKNQDYIVKLDNILLSSDKKHFFIIFKGNNTNLKNLIDFKGKNYLDNKSLIKWIVYQITFGLYILHFNGIIHNDIKPPNILIDEESNITICDFGSATYKGKESNSFTNVYAPPEFLYNQEIMRDEKSDMWALGVIMIELHLKKNVYFNPGKEIDFNTQLKYILSKFGINENLSKEEINKLIFDNSNHENCIKFEKEEIEKIHDEDALELIHNLITLNPNKRFSAKQVLDSNYLAEYKDCHSFDLTKIEKPIDYEEIFDELNEEKFVDIYKKLTEKMKA